MTPTLKLEAVYLMDYESLEGMAAGVGVGSRTGELLNSWRLTLVRD
jgi:hypothetical protein